MTYGDELWPHVQYATFYVAMVHQVNLVEGESVGVPNSRADEDECIVQSLRATRGGENGSLQA